MTVTEDERRQLPSLAHRRRTASVVARRARIILACADGMSHVAVARRLRVAPATVGKWRQRFLEARLDGLLDEPRPGTPRRITDAQVEAVIVKTLESTPRGATPWSTRGMADERTGQVLGETHARHHAVEFRTFLDAIDANVPADLDVHVILDHDGTHQAPIVRHWFAKRPRYHLHVTPTDGSWLTLVERWCAGLTNRQRRRGVHRSVSALIRAIREYIEASHLESKPFVWTKTADEILASIARFAQRTAAAL
mgnify:CR=1 FL=1